MHQFRGSRHGSKRWQDDFKTRKGDGMLCMECGANADKGYTTDVTDLGNCLVIVRNIPCYKCTECNETIYTSDVVRWLEEIVEQAQNMMQEIAVIDYGKVDSRVVRNFARGSSCFLSFSRSFCHSFVFPLS